MKGFKGFEKGLVCRGKQYEENTVFEEESGSTGIERSKIFVREAILSVVF